MAVANRSLCGVCLCPHPSPSVSCVAVVQHPHRSSSLSCMQQQGMRLASRACRPATLTLLTTRVSLLQMLHAPTTLLGQNPARPKPFLQTRFMLFLWCAQRWLWREHVVSRPDCKPTCLVCEQGRAYLVAVLGGSLPCQLTAVVALMAVVARVTYALGRGSNVHESTHQNPLLLHMVTETPDTRYKPPASHSHSWSWPDTCPTHKE